MTAKDLKNKGGVERGVTREQRAIRRRKQLEASLPSSRVTREQRAIRRREKLEASLLSSNREQIQDGPKRRFPKRFASLMNFQARLAAWRALCKKRRAVEYERFAVGLIHDRVFPFTPFKERLFGHEVEGQDLCGRSVVSLALYDGNCAEENMLFACSGIALPHGTATQELTSFVTSACLVEQFIQKRNKDDDLRIQVRLPNNKIRYGLLGLYDKDIAIVTSLDYLNVHPVDLNLLASPDHSDGHVFAAGRAFKSGSLMALGGSVSDDIFLSDSTGFITEVALGGPLVGNDERFHGMIVGLCDDGDENRKRAKFLSQKSLRERLELFQILNPKKLDFRGYKLPPDVSSVIPSGFMDTYCQLRSDGYPLPPPLVLELNGKLLNDFEDRFGQPRAWSRYPYLKPTNDSGECVWAKLKEKVVNKISRRVVSLASFKLDYSRSFACTGLLIKWPERRAKHTVVLTSASLVRSHDDGSKIDEKLRIEVFLPPNQRRVGTLELYDLDKNIAIVSVEKHFNAIQPEDIFNEAMQKSPSEKVVALGRDTMFGLLMGTIGEVKHNYKDHKLECQELQYSSCKITKVGIGGPLIDFRGTFVGMNFYDERDLTPFLPRDTVVDALKGTIDSKLPSESGCNPMRLGDPEEKKNRWPVPEPYWYHGALDVDMYDVPELMGRTLM